MIPGIGKSINIDEHFKELKFHDLGYLKIDQNFVYLKVMGGAQGGAHRGKVHNRVGSSA